MLTETAIARAKPAGKPRKLHDAYGLYLLLMPTGGRWWRWDYRLARKRKTISLGTYPVIKLQRARELRDVARLQLAGGADPSLLRKAERHRASGNTFRHLAEEWYSKLPDKLSSATRRKLRWLLDRALLPQLGDLPVEAVTPPRLLATLRLLEAAGLLETVARARAAAGRILRYGIAIGVVERDSAADLIGAFKTSTVTHHAALIEPRDIGLMLARIHADREGSEIVNAALQLSPVVFVRPGELRHMRWADLDFDDKLWRLPRMVMKQRRPHLVPLATQSIAILRRMQILTGDGQGEFVFPTVRSKKRPMSNGTVNAALRRLGYAHDQMTGHGFRTLASTRLHEMGFESDWIEIQLAHKVPGVKGIYNQAAYLEPRRQMMQQWADYLDGLRGAASPDQHNKKGEER